jgi:hypothetical protein
MEDLQDFEVQEMVEELMSEILALRNQMKLAEEDFDMAVDAGDKKAEAEAEAALNEMGQEKAGLIRELKNVMRAL